MYEHYHAHGVQFLYPQGWELSEDGNENETSITVQNAETSFWSISLFANGPEPHELVEGAIAALRDEYSEMDVYPAEATLCPRENVARDIEFVCLDLINGAFLRAFRTGAFSALLLYQGTNQELEETREILESISDSLRCDGDEAIFT